MSRTRSGGVSAGRAGRWQVDPHRFVTDDFVQAQKYHSEVERRAHDVNPEQYDEGFQRDREILEELGAPTEDNAQNAFRQETLDCEF